MKTRPLGSSGIEASVVAFGAWAVGGWRWGGSDDRTSVDAIRLAIDEGMTFIDTAPVYGFGHGEEIVGRAIEGRRDKVVLATKCGLFWDTDKGVFHFAADDKGRSDDGPRRIHRYLAPDAIRRDLESSLKRLRTDHVDLYLTHWQDPTTPIEETVACLLDLKQQGKIRAIGACNATTDELKRYHAAGGMDADQERYSMLDRKREEEQFPWCRKNRVATLAYSPLRHGLLTGKITPDRRYNEGDLRNDDPHYKTDRLNRINATLEAMGPIRERHGCTTSQLVIAWTVARDCTHALVGARTPEQVRENAAAGRIELTAEEVATIDGLIPNFAV